jgi:hypothetical protein
LAGALAVPSIKAILSTREIREFVPDFVLYWCSMDKRLAKRHKRQVARAKLHSKTSEPDVRTHDQIEAARDASRPDSGRGPLARFARAVRSKFSAPKESAEKAEG